MVLFGVDVIKFSKLEFNSADDLVHGAHVCHRRKLGRGLMHMLSQATIRTEV